MKDRARDERLARALRDNLARRKAQLRGVVAEEAQAPAQAKAGEADISSRDRDGDKQQV